MSERTFGDLARRDTERHLLVAVDESDNSKRAVMYLADFFCDYKNVFVTLLSIIQEPSEDYFPNDVEMQKWLNDKQQTMNKILAGYKEMLIEAGFKEAQVETQLSVRACASVGDAILKEQEKLRCCIVVVGRRGISHNEEFVFGSTSNKILHNAKNCAVMVVE
jgi:nucleotide-binding universal stress UspA family protein